MVGIVPTVIASVLLLAGPAATATAATVLPTGFLLQDIDTGMVPPSTSGPGDLLTDFAYLPDESFIATGKYGRVQWVPRVGAPRRIADLQVNSTGDLGLISVAVAPDYGTNHTVYTARTVPSTAPGSGANGILRLSGWTVDVDVAGDPTGLSDETTVLEASADSSIHSFGSVLADRDGTLWLTIGDSATNRIDTMALRALNLDDVHGKLLHIHPDGSGVSDNPFYDPANASAARSLVFASGFRSPFRFSLDPGTGLPILGDVGKNTTEEVDLVRPGYSFGWPCWEGSAPTVGYTDLAECNGVTTTKPLWEYPHNGSGAAVVGGVVYTGTAYPAAYRGRLFFGDYVDQLLWTLGFAPTGELTQAPEPAGFGTAVGRPSRFATAPGGDIVFADIGSARVRRLVYAPGNAAPVAAFSSTADPATLQVAFDAGASSDPNGDLLSYSWDFGDGSTATGATATHTYAADPDHYDVTLTVADPLGAKGTKTTTVYPGNHAPSLDVTWPDPSLTYAVGDVVHASATATDPEDGPVTVAWSSRLEHCYSATDCHQHYGATSTGPTLDLVMEGHEGDTTLWVTASATDSRGASVSEEFKVLPRQHRVSIESTWPAAFTIGDEHVSSGLFTEGLALLLVAPERGYDGLSEFHAWGDGETSRSRQVTVGTSDLTVDVVYRTPIDTRLATDAAFNTRMGAPVGVEQGDLSLRSRAFAGGVAHWSPTTGVHFVAGAIGGRYAGLGGPAWCGPPTTDEARTVGLDGYYNHFSKGCSIFWSKAGTHWVNGRIRDLWASLGWERSLLRYPAADIAKTPSGNGWLTRFQGGTVYYGSAATGARYVTGATLTKYTAMKAEASVLKYPTTHTNATGRKDGTYQHFQGGSIFWSASTGAHPVTGAIRSKYAALSWERSFLGYPKSDPFAVSGGVRQNFQGGYLVWARATGVVTAYRS
ncbi:PQQ-dependent sugar dehydrogenase [Intrasporangium mesophilum]